ncbi:heavy metal-binding domain-containing protein [Roseobacter cerasinus]|nr:heavy metal-binding domain-containing protein [Roseobacter cerasinus]
MQRRALTLVGSIAACVTLAACDVQDGQYALPKSTSTQAPAATPVAASQVQIFEGEPNRAYTVIGPLDIEVSKLTALHPTPTREAAITRLQEAAGRLGADAVINVVIGENRVILTSWGSRRATGTAVKF